MIQAVVVIDWGTDADSLVAATKRFATINHSVRQLHILSIKEYPSTKMRFFLVRKGHLTWQVAAQDASSALTMWKAHIGWFREIWYAFRYGRDSFVTEIYDGNTLTEIEYSNLLANCDLIEYAY